MTNQFIYVDHNNQRIPIKYCGVLPYSAHNSEIYFLLGKEISVKGWLASNKWSDFGGAPQLNDKKKIKKDSDSKQIIQQDSKQIIQLSIEDLINASAREGYEESMGFLGSLNDMINLIKNRGKTLLIKSHQAFICLLPIEFDIKLPVHFKNNFDYLNRCAVEHPQLKYKYIPTCEGYLEKSEVKWLSYDQLISDLSISIDLYRESFIKSIKHILMTESEFLSNQITKIK